MQIITHRINSLEQLAELPTAWGVEIDVRHDPAADRLYLHHDPQTIEQLKDCAYLDDYLKEFAERGHTFVVFNVKEAGIEKRCVEVAEANGILSEQYFLLDVEFPFLYAATRGTRNDGFTTASIAVRYSEAEPIEMTLAQQGFVDWVWIDVNTKLPIENEQTARELMDNFKTCLVSPDRWRPDQALQEIPACRRQLADLSFRLDAVMVGREFVDEWTKPL